MSEYNFQCACCLKWYNVGDTGPRPTKAELAKMVCQSCKTAPKGLAAAEARVKELEAALKEMLDNGGCSSTEWMPLETIKRARKALKGGAV